MCFWMVIFKGFHRYFVFSLWPRNPPQKTGRFKKKFHEKTWTQTDFMTKFLNFFQKKIEIFFKIFFLKVVHSTPKRRQKKIFFWKKSRPRFRPKFRFLFLQRHRVVSKNFDFFKFFLDIYDTKNGFST